MRLTIACPAAMIADANNLAMVLGFTEADNRTYGAADWRDAAGNTYAVCSMPVSDAFVGKAFAALQRPAWDPGTKISLAAATRAQIKVTLAQLDQVGDWTAKPTRITAYPGDDGLAACAAMGLTRVGTSL